jgi:hypothetical protein
MQSYRLLELAIKGLEAERDRIDSELSELRKQTSGSIAAPSPAATPAGKARPKHRMSAAARKKISEAMKRSHAARRAAAKK